MQTIAPETVYELTPAGHDVIQHRSLQLPTELRFLLMLINGVRSVGILRVVTPAAKHDDSGFIILVEYGLISALNASSMNAAEQALVQSTVAPDHLISDDVISQHEVSEHVISEHEVSNYVIAIQADPIDFDKQLPVVENDFTAFTCSTTNTDFDNPVSATADEEAAELFAFQPIIEVSADHFQSAPELAPDEPAAIMEIAVSDEDRTAVELILRRALKQDAKFAIEQLSMKQTYTDFLPMVRRLETALRKSISITEANELRNRFSGAF